MGTNGGRAARVASVLAVLMGTLIAVAGPAAAAVVLGVGPNFSSPTTVGQTGQPATLQISNQSGGADGLDNVAVDTITLVPACPNFIANCAGGTADPGVYQLSSTGLGEAGTACAGQVFSITTTNPGTGQVSFSGSPVTLGPPGTPTSLCRIDFTFNVLKVPLDSDPGTPGAQTNQIASAHGTNSATRGQAIGQGVSTATVLKASPQVTTAVSSANVPIGTTVTDTATLTNGGGPGGPTGTITFQMYGPGDATCTGAPAFTSAPVAVNGNGSYVSPSFTPTAAGTYRWVASYSGDANNNAAGPTACADPNESVVVTQATPSIVTTASAPVPLGGQINDTATLSNGFNPTGSITFNLYGPSDPACASAPVFTSTVPVAGNGNYPSPNFTVSQPGTYRWVATYSGDANNTAAGPTACADPNESVTIKANPQVTTVASGPTVVGGTISDTATLSGASNPTGTITFTLYGPNNATCTGTPAFTSTVPVQGDGNTQSQAFATTAAGTYRWVATYGGDVNNNPGGPTACGDPFETVVVNRAQPAITTVASSSSTTVGGSFHDTATLVSGLSPTGTITFNLFGPDDSTCTGVPVFASTVAMSGNTAQSGPFTATQPGTYRWIASYSGDANNTPAGPTACSDPAESVVVTNPPPTIQVAKTATPLSRPAPGGTFTFTVVITNTGQQSVTTTSLIDNIYGDLNGQGTCAVGTVIPAGGTYSCSFSGNFSGIGGQTQTDIVTATVVNQTGAQASASDDATVSLTPASSNTRPLLGDFTGDGLTDIAVWRPDIGTWYVKGISETVWGQAGDVPVPGDYAGDAKSELAVWRPSNGTWYIRGVSETIYGQIGDIPVPADYNGDGKLDIAVFRPSNGTWYVRGISETIWGTSGDIPVPADYGGDAKADIAVFRPANGVWYVKDISFTAWGQAGDIPVPANYGGDAKADIAVFRPANGVWYVKDISFTAWGVSDDIPVPGDYNGGGTDIAVWRPSEANWYVRSVSVTLWGVSTDIPV